MGEHRRGALGAAGARVAAGAVALRVGAVAAIRLAAGTDGLGIGGLAGCVVCW